MGALHLFPSPLPDETLHSVISRLHRLSGHRFARQTLSEVFGTHLVVATNNLPSHLTDLVSRLPGESEDGLRRLVEQCTMLPYFRPFLSEHQLALCDKCMRGRRAGAAKIGIGAVASRVGARNEFRLCHACMQEDEAAYGCAYWHRSHGLPGVQICFRHHTALLSLPSAKVQALRHELFLPDAPFVMACASRRPIVPARAAQYDLLAMMSHALLSQGSPRIERSMLQGCYRNRAHEIDWIDRHGRLTVPRIRECAAQYAMAFQGDADFEFLVDDEWPLQLLRKHRKSMHPLKHLVLMQLLGLPVEVLSQARDVSAKGRLKQSNSMPESWRGILQDRDARRSCFLATAPSTSLRKAADYMWLYRNDRQWQVDVLEARRNPYRSRRGRIDWAQRDEVSAALIIQLANALPTGHFARRITAAYLLAQLDIGAAIARYPDKFPLTHAALKARAESVEAYQCRRLRSILQDMRDQEPPPKRWQILKAAGLKEPLAGPLDTVLKGLLDDH